MVHRAVVLLRLLVVVLVVEVYLVVRRVLLDVLRLSPPILVSLTQTQVLDLVVVVVVVVSALYQPSCPTPLPVVAYLVAWVVLTRLVAMDTTHSDLR